MNETQGQREIRQGAPGHLDEDGHRTGFDWGDEGMWRMQMAYAAADRGDKKGYAWWRQLADACVGMRGPRR